MTQFAFIETNTGNVMRFEDADEPPPPDQGTTVVQMVTPVVGWPVRPYKGATLRIVDGEVQWVDLRTLAKVKQDKRQELAAAWKAARESGITFGTKTAPSDDAALLRYLLIRTMAGESGWFDTPIQLVDGTWELLTLSKAQTLWSAVKDQHRTLMARLRDRTEAVAAATTPAEVAAVVW